jgi:hypothetical protein
MRFACRVETVSLGFFCNSEVTTLIGVFGSKEC